MNHYMQISNHFSFYFCFQKFLGVLRINLLAANAHFLLRVRIKYEKKNYLKKPLHPPSCKARIPSTLWRIKDVLICSLELIIFCRGIFPPQARAIKMAQVPLSGRLIGGSNGPARVCHFAPSTTRS